MAEKKKRPSTNARTKAAARIKAPSLPPDELVQRAEKALHLVEQHPSITERLEPGAAANLRSDVDAYTGKRESATLASVDSRTATAAQHDALKTLNMKVSSVRNAVSKSTDKAEVRKGYGLHLKIKPDVVTSVTTAGKAIVKRATAEKTKAEARSFGILDSDVIEIQRLTDAVEQADKTQEKLRAAKPLSTRERNLAANRIWAAIKNISAKGIMTFAFDETIRAQFDELDDLPKKKRVLAGG